MAVDKRVKAKVIKKINCCLFESDAGRNGLGRLQKECAEVPKTSFYRWAKKCMENPPANVVNSKKAEILELAKRRSPRASVKTAERKLKKSLPVVPAAATIASIGVDKLDFMFEMEKLYADVDLVRKRAVKTNADGIEEARNPKLLLDCVKARKGLLDTLVNAQHLLLDMNRLARIHNTILETIAKDSPATFEKIVNLLESLDAEMGYSLH